MKTFTKGTLTTTVDDDDRRIPDYLANGWKETTTAEKAKDDADKRIDKAIGEANESEGKGGGKGKNSAPDKKVNDAVDAAKTAEGEREAVDDGLIKAEAAKK
ncbi:hypothetical protein [uncultured Muribaculum sp.]|uniref:hypothetical protein n=1 Tax=uncultured Muribaculum sp. TaxID=1918613 RepID=UPI0026670161|nr:hypothetical protein [uncultured Muribaculum sp.]